jgi:hypothetical protein
VNDLGPLSFRDRLRAGQMVPIVSSEAIFDLAVEGHQSQDQVEEQLD